MLKLLSEKLIQVAHERGISTRQFAGHAYHRHFAHCIVLLGTIATEERSVVMQQVDVLLNEVLEIRKISKAITAGDIYLMLVGEAGTAGNLGMEAIAAEIERDDRLARKYVWLPSKDGTNFIKFVDRTFLATPWETPDGDKASLNLLSKDVAMPSGWETALLNTQLESIELVKELIRLEN